MDYCELKPNNCSFRKIIFPLGILIVYLAYSNKLNFFPIINIAPIITKMILADLNNTYTSELCYFYDPSHAEIFSYPSRKVQY